MAFETYWMQVFSPISRKLKNGLHLIEAEPWRKNWWKVKPVGALRSTYVSPRVWSANPTILYTGQPFGLAMQELHKKELPNAPTLQPSGPVCQLSPTETRESAREADRAAFTRPDRVRRQRTVRRTRRTKA